MVALKHMKKNTQVVLSAISSGSVSYLKWFCQLSQVVQSAISSGSVSYLK